MAEASACSASSTPVANSDLPTSPVHQVTEAEVAEAVLHDQVQFLEVKECYPPDQDITLRYAVGESVEVSSHDWVGVYKVGWKSPKNDYFTFVWSPEKAAEEGNERSIVFATRYLPTDQGSYQFCYVTKSGDIRGCSSYFRIREDFTDDDLVCVELDGEVIDAVLVQSRARQSRDEEEKEACISDLQASALKAELEIEDLKSQIECLSGEKSTAQCEVVKVTARCTALEGQLQQVTADFQSAKARSEELAGQQKREAATLVAEIEGALADKVRQLEVLRTSGEAYTEKISSLQEDNIKLSAQLDGVHQELADSQQAQEESHRSNIQLKDVNKQYQDELAQLSDILDQKRQEEDQMTAALSMANERALADKMCIDAKDEEIFMLNKRLVDAGDAHTAELASFVSANDQLRDDNENLQSSLRALRDEAAALRISLEQAEPTDMNFAVCNVAELMGENEALKKENAELHSRLLESEQQPDETAASEGALFALQKAFDDSQTQCEKWQSKYRKQARLTRTAEATIKQLEGEVAEQRRTAEDLRRRVAEGASHYKAKYLECEELRRRQDRMDESEAALMARTEELQHVAARLESVEQENNQLQADLLLATEQVEEFKREKQRLEVESCRLLVGNSLRPDMASAAATSTSLTNSLEAGEEPRRYCPVCSMELPWTMAMEDVEQHCAQHFDDDN